MGIIRKQSLIHWNYFLTIEDDLSVLSRYVDFSEKNSSTFSLEIAKILMAASAEIDVVLKQLCISLNSKTKATNINEYYNAIVTLLPEFKTFKVTIPTQCIELTPWSLWKKGKPPQWWQANNKVKHHRHEHFEQASLNNCLNSVAALYISVLYLYHDEATNGRLLKLPKLFNVADEFFGGTTMGRYGHSFKYKLENKTIQVVKKVDNINL